MLSVKLNILKNHVYIFKRQAGLFSRFQAAGAAFF